MPDARTPKRPAVVSPNVNVAADPAATAATEDWRETLPEDWTAPGRDDSGAEVQLPLRKHPALAKYATKDEAIKALVHAQRLLGKKGDAKSGSLLSQGAPESEPGSAFASACPAAPGDYQLPDIPLPEDFRVDEALRAAYLDKAHELGLSDAQAAGLYAWFLPLNVEGLKNHETRVADERQQLRSREMDALRQVHGGAAKKVLEAARTAVLALGGEELIKRLEACGAADDARVVQAFARIAPLVSEAGMRGQAAGPAQAVTPQRLREMMRDPRYFDPSRRDKDFVRQVLQGFETLYPGEQAPALRASM